jgi:two-component system heavy metal sensor histidine kinase CusS
MSSKNVPEPSAPGQPARNSSWSLATRLTAWYAGSAFALILLATGYLYWALVRNLDREDDGQLADTVRYVQELLKSRRGDPAAIRREIVEAAQARLNIGLCIRVVSGTGLSLAETEGMKTLPVNSFPTAVGEPGRGINLHTRDGRHFRGLAVRTNTGGADDWPAVIQVAMDRSEEEELLADFRENLWVVLGGALAACAMVGYRIARRGIRPLSEITETARRIRSSNLGERIASGRLPAELHSLAETFNQMLDRLEQSFARLSRFSADIAHELRTPINNLRGEVEVALGKPRTALEYREVLESSLEECGRLARMIDSLLFLARAENPRTQIDREPFDVGRELASVREFYEASAAEAGVGLDVRIEGSVAADLNRPLFQRAVANLLAKAIAHTPPGGTVILGARDSGTATRVEVADTGCGIPAAHLAHVFDRFYRVDDARSSAEGGMGLGLAIVRSIVELHGGAVEIVSEVGQGTRAVMTFPRRTQAAPPGHTSSSKITEM